MKKKFKKVSDEFLQTFIQVLSFLLAAATAFSQDTVYVDEGTRPCGMEGSARLYKNKILNPLKNRWNLPGPEDFDPDFTMENLVDYFNDENSYDDQRAGTLTGYVVLVKSGGPESCNCSARRVVDHDTHINMVVDLNDAGADRVVVVEVTPRLRAMIAQSGFDWSTKSLKKQLLGKRVRIGGWLFYDPEHLNESFATDPEDIYGKPNWRATSWEIHPVTSIEILNK